MDNQSKPVAQPAQQSKKKAVKPSMTPEQRQVERRERFLRLAKKRVEAAYNRIQKVANLGNRATYSYTPEEAETICNTLLDAASKLRESFSVKRAGRFEFTL